MKNESSHKCVVIIVPPDVNGGEIVRYECELHVNANIVIRYVVLIRYTSGVGGGIETVIRLISENPGETFTAAATWYLYQLTAKVVLTAVPVDMGLTVRREKYIPSGSMFSGAISCGPLVA